MPGRDIITEQAPGCCLTIRVAKITYLFTLVLVLLTACGQRPSTDNVAKFAAALNATQLDVGGTLTTVSQFTVDEIYRGYAIQAAAASRTRGLSAAPQRPVTPGDIAQAALDPAFVALKDYGARLADLTGDAIITQVDDASGKLAASAEAAATTLGKIAGNTIPASAIGDGKAAIQALARFAVEQKIAANLPPIIRRMHGEIVKMDAFISAVIGSDDSIGLRLALADARTLAAGNLEAEVAVIGADRRGTAADKIDRIQAKLHGRDGEATKDLLNALLAATHNMVAAHRSLIAPTSSNAEAQVEAFVASAQRLAQLYQKFRKP